MIEYELMDSRGREPNCEVMGEIGSWEINK
jgi:hypothetical protein